MMRIAFMYNIISGTLSFISWGTMFQAFMCYLFNQVEHLRTYFVQRDVYGSAMRSKSAFTSKVTPASL